MSRPSAWLADASSGSRLSGGHGPIDSPHTEGAVSPRRFSSPHAGPVGSTAISAAVPGREGPAMLRTPSVDSRAPPRDPTDSGSALGRPSGFARPAPAPRSVEQARAPATTIQIPPTTEPVPGRKPRFPRRTKSTLMPPEGSAALLETRKKRSAPPGRSSTPALPRRKTEQAGPPGSADSELGSREVLGCGRAASP